MSLRDILNINRNVEDFTEDSTKDTLIFPIDQLKITPMGGVSMYELMITIFLQHHPKAEIDNLYCFFRNSEKDLVGNTFKFKNNFLILGITLTDLTEFLSEGKEVDQLVMFDKEKCND